MLSEGLWKEEPSMSRWATANSSANECDSIVVSVPEEYLPAMGKIDMAHGYLLDVSRMRVYMLLEMHS